MTLEQWLADLDVQDAGELAETFHAERWRVVKLVKVNSSPHIAPAFDIIEELT